MSQPPDEFVGFSPAELIALARTDFATFVELMFPILHNGKSMKYAPYIEVVCGLMMNCGRGGLLRIIVYMKSLLISVLFVA